MKKFFLVERFKIKKDYSEETAKLIDDEVVKIVRKAQRKAKSILKSKVKYLHQIAEALLKYETINGDDLLNIMNGNAIVRSSNGI